MTFAKVILVLAASIVPLFAQAKPVFKASLHLLRKQIFVGEEPLVLFTITNLSNQMVFIDQGQFRTTSHLQFTDEPLIPGGLPGTTISGSSHQPKQRYWPSSSILGIKAGNSVTWVVQASEAKKIGKALLSVTAGFRASFVDTISDADWSEHIFSSAELTVRIQPKAAP